jgi:hypothetical protein
MKEIYSAYKCKCLWKTTIDQKNRQNSKPNGLMTFWKGFNMSLVSNNNGSRRKKQYWRVNFTSARVMIDIMNGNNNNNNNNIISGGVGVSSR